MTWWLSDLSGKLVNQPMLTVAKLRLCNSVYCSDGQYIYKKKKKKNKCSCIFKAKDQTSTVRTAQTCQVCSGFTTHSCVRKRILNRLELHLY